MHIPWPSQWGPGKRLTLHNISQLPLVLASYLSASQKVLSIFSFNPIILENVYFTFHRLKNGEIKLKWLACGNIGRRRSVSRVPQQTTLHTHDSQEGEEGHSLDWICMELSANNHNHTVKLGTVVSQLESKIRDVGVKVTQLKSLGFCKLICLLLANIIFS